MEKTLYERMSEQGLLANLSTSDLEMLHRDHVKVRKSKRPTFNAAHAEVFNWMQRNDPDGLVTMMKTDTDKFNVMQESYLRSLEVKL